jgi:membrane-bound lytic murein transglycosylase A
MLVKRWSFLLFVMVMMTAAHSSSVEVIKKSGEKRVDISSFEPLPPDVQTLVRSFAELEGWEQDDHAAVWTTFYRSCQLMVANVSALRQGRAPSAALMVLCQEAVGRPSLSRQDAKAFFEQHFVPFEIRPANGAGFLTGYYEPVIEGAWERSESFAWPLLARPADLITIPPQSSLPGIAEGYSSARQTGASTYEIYPDRAAIEEGALGSLAQPILYVRDEAEAFSIQVQGSARIQLQGDKQGRTSVRVAYAGRNGHPYTSVGRRAVEKGFLTREVATMDNLMMWLRTYPIEGRALIRENRSFVFFRLAQELDDALGPLGAASVQLTPERSLAVDRTMWSYGTPIWMKADLSDLSLPRAGMVQRLMVAQDTGSAITGAARADYFAGSGEEARVLASRIRHPFIFTVLVPRAEMPK